MPTYDYACRNCGHQFELFQSMTAPVKRKCPECGRNRLERLIGIGAGVLFKGSGFYETDYRSESYRKAAAAESKVDGKTAEKAADSKPNASDAKTDASTKESKKPSSPPGKKRRRDAESSD